MNLDLGEEIGRGGFGTVYELKGDKSKAVKVSNKNSGMNCRKWSDEFAKINDICMKKMPKLKHVAILQPDEFTEKDGLCYMILPRIFRHDCKIKSSSSSATSSVSSSAKSSVSSSAKSSSPLISPSCKNKPTIHPLLGQEKREGCLDW